VVASYGAKSAQIKAIAEQLNLGLDSFVFIDDNLVEIAEVSVALPTVTCFKFPESEAGLPELFSSMARCFSRSEGTMEDSQRTELYRHRLSTMPPSEENSADTSSFLTDLQMKLEITNRTRGDRQRAIQLINKTNQFNLNGRRFDNEEIDIVLESGGTLLTATLSDRMGTHGEISALLISADQTVLAWVLSCRVFQRQVEYALLAWLPKLLFSQMSFDFFKTKKNLPIHAFFSDPAFIKEDGGSFTCDVTAFAKAHMEELSLFQIVERQID
jgi:FkbH-like protein